MNLTLQQVVDSGIKLTPMMEQYYSIKKNLQDTILLFRMGDFYELFFEDAEKVSQLLNITLTHRGKLGDVKIPMAGIPHHAASNYIDRLTQLGYKAAICEQVQNPKDAVGIVKRAVTQVVSPGIPFDFDKSDNTEHRYIAACALSSSNSVQRYHLVFLDFTTGELNAFVYHHQEEFLEGLFALAPKEILTFHGQWTETPIVSEYCQQHNVLSTCLAEEYFQWKNTEIFLDKMIPGAKRDRLLKEDPQLYSPLGALAYYIHSTQGADSFQHIRQFKITDLNQQLKVGYATLTGLEILPRSKDLHRDCLLYYMDKTVTSLGTRALKKAFLSPSKNVLEINEKLDAVEWLIKNPNTLKEARDILKSVRDIDRILAKISTKKAVAQDLLNLSHSIQAFDQLLLLNMPSLFFTQKNKLASMMDRPKKLSKDISDTINDEIGASLDKGNLIKFGVNSSRDRLWKLGQNAEEEVAKLEAKYRQQSKIQKLKIKSNNINGMFIEITRSHTDKVPAQFVRKQTLVNAERYSTKELEEFEKDLLSAQNKLEKLEREIFNQLLQQTVECQKEIQQISEYLAQFDKCQSLATVALQENFVRPELSENKITELKGVWHPIIKSQLKDQFIGHDIKLDEKSYFALITGPNMAGKTTAMREVAIAQFLAQLGSFVPAKSATLGVCDAIFGRLGASDDILKGQSTFMVEMSETSEILRHATSQSLVILDELGRGTSTYDGLGLAWAILEHFVNKIGCRTLFATHYHELIEVVEKTPGAKNLTVETLVEKGKVQFLYRLIEGGAAQSYGIYVAKLAGLPESILKRSEHLLHDLESHHHQQPKQNSSHSTSTENNNVGKNKTTAPPPRAINSGDQLSFFDAQKEDNEDCDSSEQLLEKLQRLEIQLSQIKKCLDKTINKNLDQMTPLNALLHIHQLKESLKVLE